MDTLYLDGPSVEAHLDNRCLLITNLDTGEKRKIPLFSLGRVVCIGRPRITMPLLYEMMRQDITVVFLTGRGHWINSLAPTVNGNAARRLRQYEICGNHALSFPLARALVDAKIHNMRRTLQRLAGARKATKHPEHQKAVKFLATCRNHLSHAENHASLRGLEGAATSRYFSQLDQYLPAEMPFVFRSRRPPLNPVNALLSWAYAIVTADVCDAIRRVDLDPALGFLHEPELGRPSLALDLLEPLRAPLCDMLVMHLINHNVLSSDDFSNHGLTNGIRLQKSAKRKFFEAYEKSIHRCFKITKEKNHTCFKNVILWQAQKVCDFLKEGNAPSFFFMP